MSNAVNTAKAIWMAATQHPLGVGIVVTDPVRARVQLYTSRRELSRAGVEGLDNYTVRTSPLDPACQLWIIPKRA